MLPAHTPSSQSKPISSDGPRLPLDVRGRAVEFTAWVLISLFIFLIIYFNENIHRKSFDPIVVPPSSVLGPIGILVLVVVFDLVFDVLPFQAIKSTRRNHQKNIIDKKELTNSRVGINRYTTTSPAQQITKDLKAHEMSSATATELFSYYATSSRLLSQSLYKQAGVYLFIGAAVAFMGLIFFYVETTKFSSDLNTGLPMLVLLAPKLGILFFIELVAFFFLRQYRAAMDEFRYYEAIKRNREETLALIRCAADSGKPLDPFDLVKNESFFSKAGILRNGQSSELIESRKLEKNELDILERVIDIVQRSKR